MCQTTEAITFVIHYRKVNLSSTIHQTSQTALNNMYFSHFIYYIKTALDQQKRSYKNET